MDTACALCPFLFWNTCEHELICFRASFFRNEKTDVSFGVLTRSDGGSRSDYRTWIRRCA